MTDLFESIRLQRFLSHMDTTLQLANRGLVLLAGPNGAGKSACLPDGLLFAAFGKTLRGVAGPKLVNRVAGENGLVTLTGFDRHGTHWVLERPIKHRKKPKTTIVIGTERHTGDVEVDRVLRQILGGCGYDAFVAAVIFGKGDARFFTQLPDAKRKQILDELLSFGDLNRFLEAAKTAVARIETEAGDQLRQLEVLTARIEELSEQQDSLTHRAENFETLRKQELQTCAALLKTDRQALPVARQTIVKLEKGLTRADGLQTEAAREHEAALAEANVIRDASQVQEKSIAVLQTKAMIVRERLTTTDNRVRKMQELSGQPCPTCQQAVTAEFTDACVGDLLSEADASRRDLAALEQKMKQARAVYGQLVRAVREAQDDAVAKRNAANEARQLAEKTKLMLTEKRCELRDVEQRIGRTEAEQQKIRARENEASVQLETLQAKARELTGSLERLEADATAQAERKLYYEFWVKAFGNAGIKSLLLDGVAPRLNASADRYSQLLTDGIMRVRFSPNRQLADGRQKEEFTVEVEIDDAAPSYDLSSDGQRRRADIIATLALGDVATSRVGVPLNLLVLDEIFDGLDPAGMERAVQLLQHMAGERSSIFCMTHSESMAGYFPTTIRVERHGGISQLLDETAEHVVRTDRSFTGATGRQVLSA